MNLLLSKQIVAPIAVIFGGLFSIFFLSGAVENNRPPLPVGYEDRDLVMQGSKLKDFTLGLNGLIADWYWMQSLQYLGGKFAEKPDAQINVNDLREFNPKLLYPLLDNSVSFDPKFIGVYEYGAVVLPAIDPKLAIEIVNKGIEANPQEWRLYNQLGYIYWRNGEYEKAAEAYENASEIADAPPVMKAMVAKMKTSGSSRETAREIYSQMFADAADANSKKTFELFILKLDALDQLDAVNSVLNDFLQKNGRCVSDPKDLFQELSKIKLPNNKEFRVDGGKNIVDPTGAPYVFDRKNCSIDLDKKMTKLPLN